MSIIILQSKKDCELKNCFLQNLIGFYRLFVLKAKLKARGKLNECSKFANANLQGNTTA